MALMGTSLLTTCGYRYHIYHLHFTIQIWFWRPSKHLCQTGQDLWSAMWESEDWHIAAMWESEDWHIAASGDKLKWQNTSKDP